MSFLRIIGLASYLFGLLGLVLGIAMRLGLPLLGLSARGALIFAAVCFLCTLATPKVMAMLEKPKAG